MSDNLITPAELEAWRAAREKATSGEWHTGNNRKDCTYVEGNSYAVVTCAHYASNIIDGEAPSEDNAAFIALAANNWMRLLSEITRLQAECDHMIDENNGAFWTGYEAQSEKRDKSTNPYETESRLGKQWGRGWDFSRNTEQLGEAQKEITRLQAECDRLEKRLDGHECCGVCGAVLPNDMLRYGVLGDDAGWVCNDCIAVSEMEDQHAGQ